MLRHVGGSRPGRPVDHTTCDDLAGRARPRPPEGSPPAGCREESGPWRGSGAEGRERLVPHEPDPLIAGLAVRAEPCPVEGRATAVRRVGPYIEGPAELAEEVVVMDGAGRIRLGFHVRDALAPGFQSGIGQWHRHQRDELDQGQEAPGQATNAVGAVNEDGFGHAEGAENERRFRVPR